jgi:UDP-N-acetylmuramoyl-tripeptide--D-alanyl-D-alanine ligase
MIELSIKFIIEQIQGQLLSGNLDQNVVGLVTDSRQIKPGDLFIALQGEKYDGHTFIAEVLHKGAAAVIISNEAALGNLRTDKAIIKVNDTLQALQDLAYSYRRLFNIPMVVITGSVGKTSTKDLLAAFLSKKLFTLKTPGNYNNDIGLPLTLLQLNPGHEAAVVEIGMRARGEIKRLAKIIAPDYAIITNVEPVHLETLGSIENIAAAKCELLDYIHKDGWALINGDNELLLKTAARYKKKILTFGYGAKCDFRILSVNVNAAGMELKLSLQGSVVEISFPIPAAHMAMNIVAAAGTAYLMGLDIVDIETALNQYHAGEKRLSITHFNEGGILVNDTYNANPLSMQAALDVISNLSQGRKTVAILGDMFELGSYEQEGHLRVGEYVAKQGVNFLVTIGSRSRLIAEGAHKAGMALQNIFNFATGEESLPWLVNNLKKEEVILFKASRGMELDLLIDRWLA